MLPAARARLSLDGLSVGDAFGETFFTHDAIIARRVRDREVAAPPWRWTDDTEMALSIVDELVESGGIDQDRLALRFAHRMDPQRGYGPGAQKLLAKLQKGRDWRSASRGMFGGRGSFGNGAAMRAAPIGAYFADDLDAATAQAALSAEVTHAHAEGIAGAIAVAVAAALCWRGRDEAWDGPAFLRAVAARTPAGAVRAGLHDAAGLARGTGVIEAAVRLGNGMSISAPDTVPFALWSLAQHADAWDEALWHTATALGDVDTTCAVVGGVLVLRSGPAGVPEAWRRAREPLPRRAGELLRG
jgi:ADP-ribosylglycohydrolase